MNENINSIKDQLIPTNILPSEFFYNEPPYNVTSMYIDISGLYDENEENLKQGICETILIAYGSMQKTEAERKLGNRPAIYSNQFEVVA